MGLLTPPRVITRRYNVLWGSGLLAGLALLGLLFSMSLSGDFKDTTGVSAQLDTAGGAIRSGSDVKMNGLVIGSVTQVDGDADHVDLSLDISNDELARVPGDVMARVLPATVFGTSYVDLVSPTKQGPALRSGARIPQDKTAPTLELQKALDAIDSLVKALGPAELANALGSLASTVQDRGQELGATIETLDAYLGKVQPMVPTFRRSLTLLSENLETVRRIAPDVFDAIDNGLVVADHLVARQASLNRLLAGGLVLIGETDKFVTDNDERYVRAIVGSSRVIDAIYDERAGLSAGLLTTAEFARKLTQVLDGGMILVKGILTQEHLEMYTPADCPRFGSQSGDNCAGAGAGRQDVSRFVTGSLTDQNGGR